MKQDEIKPCMLCGKGVMHGGSPAFFRVKIEHMVLNMGAIRRQSGLEQMLNGNAALAFHMGPQESMAATMETRKGLVCQGCATDRIIFELIEAEEGEKAND